MSISDPQNDTSAAYSVNTIETLQSLATFGAFRKLADFVASNIATSSSLENNASFLNEIMKALHHPSLESPHLSSPSTSAPSTVSASLSAEAIEFVDNDEFANDKRYYEQIIYESNKVPTRRNWHDFFNGLIWSQFPHTKHYFNKMHIEQIQLSGNVKKRTPERDKLTHFDECGLVLFTNCDDVQTQLKEHQWRRLFIDNADKWHTRIIPLIFGHALWEMLLNPFIGITAKVTVIRLCDSELTALNLANNQPSFYATCDRLLLAHIQKNQLISAKRPWLPLPLLGIPQWAHVEQNDAFYDDESYFMPKRK